MVTPMNQIEQIVEALRTQSPLANDVLTFIILDRLNNQADIVKVCSVKNSIDNSPHWAVCNLGIDCGLKTELFRNFRDKLLKLAVGSPSNCGQHSPSLRVLTVSMTKPAFPPSNRTHFCGLHTMDRC